MDTKHWEVKKQAEGLRGGYVHANPQEADSEARNGGDAGAVGKPGRLPGLNFLAYQPLFRGFPSHVKVMEMLTFLLNDKTLKM